MIIFSSTSLICRILHCFCFCSDPELPVLYQHQTGLVLSDTPAHRRSYLPYIFSLHHLTSPRLGTDTQLSAQTTMASTSKLVFAWTTGILALGTAIALVAILFDLFVSPHDVTYWKPIALASAILDIASILTLGICASLLLLHLHKKRHFDSLARRVSLFTHGALSLTSMAVSLAALSLAYQQLHNSSDATSRNLQSIPSAGFAICGVRFLAEAIFFSLAFNSTVTINEITPGQDHDRSFSTSSELKNSPSTIHKSTFSRDETASPCAVQSSFPTTPPRKNKVRESVQSLLQPSTSMSRLIRQGSFRSSITAPSEFRDSIGNRPDDSFDTWTVDNDDPYVDRHMPYVSTRLDTIPASRPASPAKALDGPFPETDPETDPEPIQEQAPIPSPTFLRADSPASSFAGTRPFYPASSRRPSLSRRPATSDGTNANNNIHPLFRGAVPPPITLPGTVITGAWSATTSPVFPLAPDLWGPTRPVSPVVRPGSASSAASRRHALRTARSDEAVSAGVLMANMPPRMHPGLLFAADDMV